MIPGTTPTYRFKVDCDLTDLKQVCVAFAQNGKCLVTKMKDACVLEGDAVETTLTQEESFRFVPDMNAQVQILFLDQTGKKWGTRIKKIPVERSLYLEVLE